MTGTTQAFEGTQMDAQHELIHEFSRRLFAPGCRFGWFARDLAAEIRPFDAPRPPDPDENWWQTYRSLKAAVAADEGGLTGWLRLGGPQASNRREELQRMETYREGTLPQLQDRWERDRTAWYQDEWRRVSSQPQHVPRGPGRMPRRSDVVGGDHFGWQCLLTTLGSSLLASGMRVEILDLTERGTASMLTELCRLAGAADTDLVLLPEQAAMVDLFAGLQPDAIASMVVEGLRTASGDRGQRLLDNRIIDAAIRSLRPPITPARLTAALRLLLRGMRTPENAALIDDEEFDRLDAAFTDDQRAALLERLTVLEAALEPLARFGSSTGARRPLLTDGRPGGLHCAALSGTDAEVLNELLVDILVQSFIRRVIARMQPHEATAGRSSEAAGTPEVSRRPAAAQPGLGDTCAIILGAERVAPAHLEKLDNLSMTLGFSLVLFFWSLTEDVAERALQHSDVLGIMRLTNHAQAERAASLIGSEYRMVFSQEALSENRSRTLNWGWSSGQSLTRQLLGGSTTTSEQETRGEAEQEGSGKQTTYSRVHELVVEPENIQRLGSTAIEFLDLGRSTSRAPISLDVDPLRALGP